LITATGGAGGQNVAEASSGGDLKGKRATALPPAQDSARESLDGAAAHLALLGTAVVTMATARYW
jgi:hypothetical protein